MTAYYNEHDPKAAAWLRELIKAGLIAPGEVDERSIEDVVPNELVGYTQCHFFAGLGAWSYALRCAGWHDDRPVWTGSCPCQPFSVAGKGLGTDDERHLWPVWSRLIRECRPAVVFGEQVASRDVTGRASGDFNYLRGVWEREELQRVSHARLTPKISRDVPRLSERARAQAQVEQRNANGRTAERLEADASRICPCVVREMSLAGEGLAVRSGCGGDSATDRYWALRNDGHPVRLGRGLEQSLFGQDRPGWRLHDVECPYCNHGAERDDEQMGGGQSFGDCGCVERFYTDQEEERAFDAIFAGEVGGNDESAWLDVVQSDLEQVGYSVGSIVIPAAGLGAPHIRQRLYFVADAELPERRAVAARGQHFANGAVSQRKAASRFELHGEARIVADASRERHNGAGRTRDGRGGPANDSNACGMGNAASDRRKERQRKNGQSLDRNGGEGGIYAIGTSDACGMGNAASERRGEARTSGGRSEERDSDAGEYGVVEKPQGNRGNGALQSGQREEVSRPMDAGAIGATNGYWRDAEWLYCRDGKYRAVESVSESVVDGIAEDLGLVRLQSYPDRPHEERIIYAPLISKGKKRVMRLRGYGNAIVAPVAEAFVRAYMETEIDA